MPECSPRSFLVKTHSIVQKSTLRVVQGRKEAVNCCEPLSMWLLETLQVLLIKDLASAVPSFTLQ